MNTTGARTSSTLVRDGLLALERGNALDEAIMSFSEAVAADPQDRDAVLGLAVALRGARRLGAALELLDEWLHSHPDDALAHCHLGLVHHLSGSPDEALAHLSRSVALDATSAYATDAFRRIALDWADRPGPDLSAAFRPARVQAGRMVRDNPESREWVIAFAVALRGEARIREASALLERWLARFPDDAGAHAQLGMISHLDGDVSGALTRLLRAVALDPTLAYAVGVLQRIALQAAPIPEVPPRLAGALLGSPNPVLRDLPRRAFIEAGLRRSASNPDDARNLFEQGRSIDPANPVCDWHLFNMRPIRPRRLAQALLPVLPPAMSFVVLDIGARGGAELRGWEPLLHLVDFHGFEPDEQACREMEAEASTAGPRFHFHPAALDREPGGRPLHVTSSRWCSSFYRPNHRLLSRFKQYDGMGRLGAIDDDFKVQEVVHPPVTTLDAFRRQTELTCIDFIKLDVQGAELDVLEGGRESLSETLGILVEVEFVPLYEGQPLFSDVDRFLREQGFQFFAFQFTHAGHFAGRRRSPVTQEVINDRRVARQVGGQWVSADALYLRDPIGDDVVPRDRHDILKWVRLAMMADANGQAEYGFELIAWLAEHADRLGLAEAAALRTALSAAAADLETSRPV